MMWMEIQTMELIGYVSLQIILIKQFILTHSEFKLQKVLSSNWEHMIMELRINISKVLHLIYVGNSVLVSLISSVDTQSEQEI